MDIGWFLTIAALVMSIVSLGINMNTLRNLRKIEKNLSKIEEENRL